MKTEEQITKLITALENESVNAKNKLDMQEAFFQAEGFMQSTPSVIAKEGQIYYDLNNRYQQIMGAIKILKNILDLPEKSE